MPSGSPSTQELEAYRIEADRFIAELDEEYYLHYAGLKDRLELEEIYSRHDRLFTHEVVDRLIELRDGAHEPDERRRLRYLLELAVGGLIGRETKEQAFCHQLPNQARARGAERETHTDLALTLDCAGQL